MGMIPPNDRRLTANWVNGKHSLKISMAMIIENEAYGKNSLYAARHLY